ncbi:MAG TPA: acetyl-CoA C-acetyltransferase [Methylomirabilota bacterium]|jgi:acetyl-CoA acetyltransferase family protein|nr:acetyl-CoA C-acetyltransferase [Methylomirabilota bacterium]
MNDRSSDQDIVILRGARTPFGDFGGALKDLDAVELAVHAARGALDRSGVAADQVDHVVMGNVIQASGADAYLARHVGLKVGCPFGVPALTVNRLCGSGLQAIVTAAQLIKLGEAEVVLAGGTESMSQQPHIIRGARWGLRFRQGQLEDNLWLALTDGYNNLPMAITAENLAARHGISRKEADDFAYVSHMRAASARERGYFAEEIVPVPGTVRGQSVVVDHDEHIKPDTTVEKLARLPAAFKEGGVVSAGNASGINDGAAAVVVTTRGRCESLGVAPLGRIASWGVAGVDPDIMGIGPVPASRQALHRAGLEVKDLELAEINEAFAAQYLAVERELGLDREKSNVNGGAVALGHPVGASGARLALAVLHELRRRQERNGLAALCIGGGQGIAMVFEALYE